MRKPLLVITTFLFACFAFLDTKAQIDSTYFDLGRLQLKKTFTQNITIKGSDLERYQFVDLADAINVWLDGTYTNASNLVYVVDGNIINDVNAYSIYDIDQITYIQNAAAQITGASLRQHMVIIKTRVGGLGKQGIGVAGQTSLVHMRSQGLIPNEISTTSIYNNYYLSAYKNYDNSHFGVSANYQKDVLPERSIYGFGHGINSSYARFKLNGHADTKLWKGSTLALGVNYVPQSGNYGLGRYTPTLASERNDFAVTNAKQQDFTLNIHLNTQLSNKLINTISAAYNHFSYSELDSNYFANTYRSSPASISSTAYSKSNALYRERKMLLNDNIVYYGDLGGVHIEPSVNFAYRLLKDTSGYSNESLPVGDGPHYQQSHFLSYPHVSLLTSSLNIYYRDLLNVQGGAVILLYPGAGSGSFAPNATSPFITATLDIGKIAQINNFSWKVFGSYSLQNNLIDDDHPSLFGFYSVSQPGISPIFGSTNQNVPLNSYINPYVQYSSYEAGTSISLFNNLTFTYSLESQYYQTLTQATVITQIQGEQNQYIYFNDKANTTRFALNYHYQSTHFTWQTGLNITESKLQLVNFSQSLAGYANQRNDYLNVGHRWSGGFTNRFTYKSCFAGLDALYQLGERAYSLEVISIGQTGNLIAPVNNNSFSIQNLYVGARVKIDHLKYTEVYVNTRNILQNKSSDITDNRRFVGLGFKVGL